MTKPPAALSDSAAKGMQEAARHSTVGISIQSKKGAALLGSGVLVQMSGSHFILTAAHVIDGVDVQDLRFLLPTEGELKTIERPEAKQIKAVKSRFLHPHVALHVKSVYTDAALDVAALEVDETLDGDRPAVVFYQFPDTDPEPTDKDELLIVGYPQDLTRVTTQDDRVVLQHIEWTILGQPPTGEALPGFNEDTHKLAPFVSAQNHPDAKPQGLSGSAVWWHRAAPLVWHPNLALAGITLSTYPKHKILKFIRAAKVRSFLEGIPDS